MMNTRKNLRHSILLTAAICGAFSVPSFSAPKKKTKKKSSVTPACIACLNSFDSQELKFTIDPEKCPKRVANCYKSNYTNQCEDIIKECIQYNCTNASACADEIGNRNLFAGCLKAANIVLPYQCASYIAGYASTKAAEGQAAAQAQANAIKEKELAVQRAKQEAEKAKADAEAKAKQAAADAEVKKKQIEEESKIRLEQEKARLEQQAKDAEFARQQKAAQEAKANRPSARYNALMAEAKQALSTAKTYTTKAFGLLGIEKTDKSANENKGSAVYFAQQIMAVLPLENEPTIDNETRFKQHAQGSKYWAHSSEDNYMAAGRKSVNFFCTKDVKESLIKSELKNVYNTLKKANDNLMSGIADVEAANEDDETTGKISDSKIDALYDASSNLSNVISKAEEYMTQLKTSCETRCNGISSMSNFTTTSGPIEYDDNGLIVEKKKDKSAEYSCKDFDNEANSTDITALLNKSDGMNTMIGGLGKKITELTRRVVKSVIETDREIDLALAKIQSGAKNARGGSYFNGETAQVDTCVSYMFNSPRRYMECLIDKARTQSDKLISERNSTTIRNELRETIRTIIQKLGDYTNEGIDLKLDKDGSYPNCGKDDETDTTNNTAKLQTDDEFKKCIIDLADDVRKVVNHLKDVEEQEEEDRKKKKKNGSSSSGERDIKVTFANQFKEYAVKIDGTEYFTHNTPNSSEFCKKLDWKQCTAAMIDVPTKDGTITNTSYSEWKIFFTCKGGASKVLTIGELNDGDELSDCK